MGGAQMRRCISRAPARRNMPTRRGVVVPPGHFYDFEGEAYLVVRLLTPVDDFSEGLARIEGLAAEG